MIACVRLSFQISFYSKIQAINCLALQREGEKKEKAFSMSIVPLMQLTYLCHVRYYTKVERKHCK